jgi:hypothetical protein
MCSGSATNGTPAASDSSTELHPQCVSGVLVGGAEADGLERERPRRAAGAAEAVDEEGRGGGAAGAAGAKLGGILETWVSRDMDTRRGRAAAGDLR